MSDDARATRAWALIDEAMAHGTMTLADGTVKVLTAGELAIMVRWAAGQAKIPRSPMPLPDLMRGGGA